jgi:lysophospholipase L1-like esterase
VIAPEKILLRATALVALAAVGCGGPTAPSAPRYDGPLAVVCPPALTIPATSTNGAAVHYPHAATTGGQLPVTVACTPGSGLVFAIGTTTVSCTATDAAAMRASCEFPITVSPPPRLARTNFMAFGDSITAGEVTVPLLLTAADGHAPLTRQVVVPTVSYPTVLERMMAGRYVGQEPHVENEGRSGESAAEAEPRLLRALVTDRPDVVLLLMGYNDLGSSAQRLRAVDTMERMAKDARGYGARVFIATLTPGIPGRQRSLEPSAILAYNDELRIIAAGEGAVLVDLHRAFLPQAAAWIGVDGLHPTEAGYALIAETFFAAIRADLERD